MIVNKSNIFLKLSWIWPWFCFLDFVINHKKYYVKKNNISKLLLLSCLFPTVLYNYSFVYFINLLFLISIFLIYKKEIEKEKLKDIGFFTTFYFTIGGIYGLITLITTNVERVGFFNSEINFSSFYVFLFFVFCNEYKLMKTWSFLLVLLNLGMSGSRTFLLMLIIYVLVDYFKDKIPTIIFYFFLFLTTFLIINLEYLLDILLLITNQEKSGYVTDYRRLFVFHDTSSQVRIDVNSLWMNNWFSDIKSFFWGIKNYSDVLFNIGYKPHNSLIQKGSEFGFVYVSLVYIFVLSRVKLNVGIPFLIYGLFLHNLYSIPIMYILYLYFPKNKKFS